MIENMTALAAGAAFGLFMSFLKLPIPAPNVLAGVTAVFGAFLGGEVYKLIAPLLNF